MSDHTFVPEFAPEPLAKPLPPTFIFSLRDAAKPETAKAFVELVISTGRFARNEKGSVVWSPAPNDWVPIARANEFRAILEDGEIIRVTGDVNSDAYFTLWMYVADRRWKLPRIGGAWNPDKPLPVRNAGRGPGVRS